MANRLQLQAQLEMIVGTRNVFFQPPPSLKLTYPCIVYYLDSIRARKADDLNYNLVDCYSVVVIDSDPDNQYAKSILEKFAHCYFSRRMAVNNLYHDYLTLYY